MTSRTSITSTALSRNFMGIIPWETAFYFWSTITRPNPSVRKNINGDIPTFNSLNRRLLHHPRGSPSQGPISPTTPSTQRGTGTDTEKLSLLPLPSMIRRLSRCLPTPSPCYPHGGHTTRQLEPWSLRLEGSSTTLAAPMS